MECNKDDALRAKELSEKKMVENDFEGARSLALKAQKLHPGLENMSQLLSVCDVHCSSKKKMLGVDKDWYAILQIEQFSDESTIRKQYRRLALVLHPDKNRLPGAEAAFKLISEANAILTDTGKKSLYDNKIRAAGSMKVPPSHMNRSANFNQHYAQSTVFNNGSSNLNQQHATSSSFVRQDVFWTCCAFCGRRYQYQREHINKNLRCQSCSRTFFACDIGGQAKSSQPPAQVPLKPRPGAFHQKVELNQAYSKVGVQVGKGFSSTDAGLNGFASRKAVHPEPGVKAGSGGINVGGAFNGNGDLKANGTSYRHGGKSDGIPTKETTANLKNRKRGRKMVLESSESSDSSEDSDTDDEILESKSGGFATDNNPETVHIRRRSSRLKQNVYKFNESDDDDDFASPIKRPKESKISEDKNAAADANCSKATSKDKVTSHSEESLPGKDAKCDTNGRGDESGAAETVQVEFDTDAELESGDKPDVDCPDPEFYDFDKERESNCFKINQTWACYDDGEMPRYYARITKVKPHPFELSFKWLEVVPISEANDKWVAAELPVGCGTFKLGRKIEKTTQINTFSHQMMPYVPGKKKATINIYPREKEVWALFKDWDIGWSSNPEKHVEFQYEVVEVLSNCLDDGAGIRVCYLDKVVGFVSLFQRSSRSGLDSFWIRPDELYRFSHRVPSSKALIGTERDGVPVGSFELDPASLPLNSDDLYFSSKAKKESETSDPAVRSPKRAEGKGKTVKSAATVDQNSFIDLDD